MASNKSHSSSYRSTVKSKSSRASTGGSSRSMVNAIIQAATKKAEMECRAKALKVKFDLELEEFKLRERIDSREIEIKLRMKELEQHKEMLAVQTEVQVQEAKLATLQEYDNNSEASCGLDILPEQEGNKEQSVQQWVQNGTISVDSLEVEQSRENLVKGQVLQDQLVHIQQMPSPVVMREPVTTNHRNVIDQHGQSLQSLQPHQHNVDQHVFLPEPRVKENPWLSSTPGMPVLSPHKEAKPIETLDYHKEQFHPAPADSVTPLSDILKTQNELTRLLAEQQIRASLPQQRIPQFSGDYLAYTSFMKSFEYGIESKTSNYLDRLYYLDQYTNGEPNNLVKSCLLYDDPKEGFEVAKGQLKKKYGNSHKIAEAFLKKAQEWPEIRNENADELNKFSLFLIECMTMMKALRALQELNHTTSLKVLVAKIPYRMRVMWRNSAYRIEEEEGNVVVFKDFVAFVDRQARIISNPAYGKVHAEGRSASGGNSNPASKKPIKRGAFGTSVQNNTCLFCGENSKHILKDCRKFCKENAEFKSDFCFKNGLCFGCLGSGHRKSKCPQPEQCEKCKKRHPTSLHDDDRKERKQYATSQSQATVEPPEAKKSQENQQSSRMQSKTSCLGIPETMHGNGNPLMAVIPVSLKLPNSNNSVATYAFLDDGCGAVFVDPNLCEILRANTQRRSLLLRTLNTTEVVDSALVVGGMQVSSMDKEYYIDLPEVYVKGEIPVTEKDMPTQDDLDRYLHLSQLELPKLRGDTIIPKVTIMIGANVPEATTPLDTLIGEQGDPYAIKTPLGWVVHGMAGKLQDHVSVNLCQSEVIDGTKDLEQKFQSYMNMEFNEKLSDHRVGKSVEDQRFLDIVSSSIEFKNGKYHIALPLRDEDVTLPDNRQLAETRAEALKRKFKRDPQYYSQYKTTMDKVIQSGFAEKVPDDEQTVGKKWYVPHHGVFHPQKGKLRVVYDCAATYKGTSLNQQVLQGPDLTNSLVGVLLRFRQEPVAILADIESMFYQVMVREEDRNYLRFLWWEEGEIERPIQDYRMKVHIFGAASSPACANYALKQTADDNKSHFDAEVVETLHNNFYVDDCLKSTSTEAKATALAHDLRAICAKGGFRLTKWVSNRKAVLESIPANERAETTRNLDLEDSLPNHRALGMLWSMESDSFRFNIDVCNKPPTRRGMLSILSSVYDPLGLVSPAILPCKRILQDLCKLKIGWDEKIPNEYLRKWNNWVASLPELEQLTIDRCLKPEGFEDIQSIQVHHFSDASDIGYGTASYLRVINSNGDIECNLIVSKSRVSPLKQVSIPRMELSAATVAVKIDAMLKREMEFPIDKTVFWTDSQTVLKYIKNEKARYPVFVANRISIIRDGSDVGQWRYIPSKLNPADHSSRGLSVSRLISLQQWLKGPDFLREADDTWPEFHSTEPAEPNVDEPANEANLVTAVNVVQREEHDDNADVSATVNMVVLEDQEEHAEINQDVRPNDPVNQLISHYSDWTSLKRAMAWWLRLKQVLLCRSKKTTQENYRGPLTTEELDHAEIVMIKTVQRKSFPDEYQVLKDMQKTKSTRSLKKGSSLAKLDPVMKDGMMCVGGRLRNAAIPDEAKHQIILPKNHHISTLIIRHTHQRLRHQGRNHVLAEIRRKYWIINAGVSIKKEVRRCVICRRVQATVSTQKMADLPASRLQADEPPFTRTGLDYFGPFHIKQGRTVRKRYGVVFTCLASRAVHLEVAGSLDTDACINALRRFISRRGPVKELISDNGTNLVGANEELRRAFKDLDQETLQRFSANSGIVWKFNPPTASHHGGVWERQIRTIRKILNSILVEQHLKTCQSEEELHTFLCEVEAVINSRPLTRVSDDPADMNVITPNDLLLLVPSRTPPPGCFNEKDVYVRRRWRQVQYLADVFWKRWTREYLPTLQQRQKWLQPERNLQVGDVVLVVDDKAPRNSWLMGRIEKVNVGSQGLVRSAAVKTKTSVLTRPVTKLCMLLEQES